MAAPLIVHDPDELREDRQEVVLMLHDFTFRMPDEVLAELIGATPAAADVIAEGSEQVSRMLSRPRGGMMANTSAGGMPDMAMTPNTMPTPPHMQMDLNDVHYDAFLANDHTLADPY